MQAVLYRGVICWRSSSPLAGSCWSEQWSEVTLLTVLRIMKNIVRHSSRLVFKGVINVCSKISPENTFYFVRPKQYFQAINVSKHLIRNYKFIVLFSTGWLTKPLCNLSCSQLTPQWLACSYIGYLHTIVYASLRSSYLISSGGCSTSIIDVVGQGRELRLGPRAPGYIIYKIKIL